jgi:hypothetical protein
MSVYDTPPSDSIQRRWRRSIYSYAAEVIVGSCGWIMIPLKHAYGAEHPDHILAFNASICIRRVGKIWWGDLDITIHGTRLQALADILHEPVYVLHEPDARFEREADPDYSRPAAVYQPHGM